MKAPAARGAAFALLLFFACPPAGGDGARPDFARDTIAVETADGRRHRFEVELATTPSQRAWGLMFRESLAADQGMLFLFGREAPRSFWMKNTPLPLDLLFLDRSGAVVAIARDARPFDETPIPSGVPAAAVLEVPAGTVERLGLAPGDRVRHRAFMP